MGTKGFRASLLFSPLLFVIACGMPALQWSNQASNQPMYGLLAFLDGFFGLFWGVPAWAANPISIAAFVFAFFRRTKEAAILGGIAVLFALTAFFTIGKSLPKDESGSTQMVLLHLLPGYFVWIASIAVVPAICLASGRLKKADPPPAPSPSTSATARAATLAKGLSTKSWSTPPTPTSSSRPSTAPLRRATMEASPSATASASARAPVPRSARHRP